MGTSGALHSFNDDLAITIADSRGELSQLASKDPLVQGFLDLFRATLQSHARNVLEGKEDFGKLEKILTSIINIISSLEETVLADALSAYLEVVKSSLAKLDRLRNSGLDVLTAELAASYAMTRDKNRVRLEHQIASETARLEGVSKEIEQLKFDSDDKRKTCRTTFGSIQLLEDDICQLEERLARMQNDLSSLQRDYDVALAKGVQLELAQREAEYQL